MDDLFASPDYDKRKRTVVIDGDEYKLQRDVLTNRWKCWPAADHKYAELAAGDKDNNPYPRGSREWRARYHLLWEAANNPTNPTTNPAVDAVREGIVKDRARRETAEQLARSANIEDAMTAAAD